jgi:lipopolysaccharide/colanic/teichoic acid biosynthesis glycosyltransferase
MNRIHNYIKRLFDLIFSIVGIIILIPIFLIIAIAIKLDSKGPIIFKQARIGKNGRLYNIYKFRSMIVNAENTGTGLFNYADDPRVTKVGNFLRNNSLDELLQFFNILKGEMSIVGPRPPVTYELGNYVDFDISLKRRFTVNPGVTGLAQIKGRNELSWDEKIEYDLQYIDRFQKWGILLDIKIIFITIIKLVTREGNYELPENAEKDNARIAKS